VSQRQILENSIGILKTLRGPAKILYAGASVGMPTIVENIINPTTGAPGASWIPFGLTRGGINVSKNLDIAVRDDVDQILGAYDQDITDRSYVISSQLAEILQDSFNQVAIAAALGSATTVAATTSQPTQVMRFLDDGANKTPERRWAIVFPKATNGKVVAFAFRRGAVAGGEKVFRFDKSDPASPGLEIRMFPEIATTIESEDAYGRIFEIE
jgi:hypothetical protein